MEEKDKRKTKGMTKCWKVEAELSGSSGTNSYVQGSLESITREPHADHRLRPLRDAGERRERGEGSTGAWKDR